MTPTANLVSTEADADHPAVPAAEAGPYVLNLCASTTPMALAQTDLPELKRFTFFVSRRFEEGRERFRLHMGFFASQAEAEEWLGVVREIYPGAWAGEAPGKKLRARAAEAAAAQARHAAGPQAAGPQKSAPPPAAVVPTPPAPPAAKPVVAKPQSSQAPVPANIPTLQPPASPPARKPAPAAAAVVAHPAKGTPQANPRRPPPAPAASRAAPPVAARVPTQPKAMPAAQPRLARTDTVPAGAQRPAVNTPGNRPAAKAPAAAAAPRKPAQVPAAAAAPPKPAAAPSAARPQAQAAPRAAEPAGKKPIFADSNVKEVLAALDSPTDGTGEKRLMQAPFARADAADDPSLTDTQVLRFLEIRRDDAETAPPQAAVQADAAAESGISLLKPDDTGTRRALKVAVSHNDPVAFAVQLQWSVQPVLLDKVPPLAIFSAYTLYSVEGSREGRKWYGLRLGFFNDAISAKQVAYYVRSEFNSVAVVPVSPQERERATENNQRYSGVGAPRKRRESEDNEFKLIDSDEAPRAGSVAPPAAANSVAAAASALRAPVAAVARAPAPRAAPQPAPAARNTRKGDGKVGARERRTPQTLEETLEILGANDLAIDNGSGESLNDTGVRHLRVEVQKNTPFSRLLERLSERVRKA